MQETRTQAVEILTHQGRGLAERLPHLEAHCLGLGDLPLSRHPAWLLVLQEGLGYTPYCLEAVEGGATRGLLPLAYVRSLLFGRYLTSLPYLNSGGVVADDEGVARALIGRAAALADRLDVRHLEL